MICGKEYMLQTEESPNYVYSLAKLLEKKINDIAAGSTSISPHCAAVMVALSTLDDLSKSQANVENIRTQAKEYVDEAGKARIERDAALKEVEMLKLKIDRLEKEVNK
jgi:cell division protein ZapA